MFHLPIVLRNIDDAKYFLQYGSKGKLIPKFREAGKQKKPSDFSFSSLLPFFFLFLNNGMLTD